MVKNKKLYVIKASGKKELFRPDKIRRSVYRAGIPKKVRQRLLSHLAQIAAPNIPTTKIHDEIIKFLKENKQVRGQAQYALKKAIMSFGPSGYPFEDFVARIFQKLGYQTETGVILSGRCAQHEVDVLAKKDDENLFIECKFHNSPGTQTDIKTLLYVKARFEDLRGQNPVQNRPDFGWLITNTKFTQRAIDYATCAGLSLLGWRYPAKKSLEKIIEASNLHPVTCLQSLSNHQKQLLLENNLVLCQEIADLPKSRLCELGFSKNQANSIINEAQEVCRLR